MKRDFAGMMLYTIPAVVIAVGATHAAAGGAGKDGVNAATRNEATSVGQPMSALDKDMRVSRLIGAEVVGSDGRDIGEVEDLVIDTREGNVVHAIVESDELLDVDELMAVPLDKTHGSLRDGKLVLDATAGEMRGFRRFRADAWPDFERSSKGPVSYRYRRASDLLEADVEDRFGRDVGEVEDVVVNLDSGKVRYGVAEFDPSWFEPGKLVVVPIGDVWPQDRDPSELVITADRQTLRDAPTFSRDAWPDLNDSAFRRGLDRLAGSDARG